MNYQHAQKVWRTEGEEGNPSASKGEPSPDVSISLSRSQSAPPGLQDKEGPGSQSVEQEVRDVDIHAPSGRRGQWTDEEDKQFVCALNEQKKKTRGASIDFAKLQYDNRTSFGSKRSVNALTSRLAALKRRGLSYNEETHKFEWQENAMEQAAPRRQGITGKGFAPSLGAGARDFARKASVERELKELKEAQNLMKDEQKRMSDAQEIMSKQLGLLLEAFLPGNKALAIKAIQKQQGAGPSNIPTQGPREDGLAPGPPRGPINEGMKGLRKL